MKRVLLIVGLAALFAASYAWFSHRNANSSSSVAPAPVAAAPDPKQIEREALFGSEADGPAIEWRSSGLGIRTIAPGTGPKPGIGARVKIVYTGRLKDGTIFDRSEQPSEFLIGATIPGLSVGLQTLGTGGKAVFYIPPSLGYGHRKVLGIPADSGLIFEVEMAEIAP